MKKNNREKGFTLVELLVVMGIMAVLIMIAIAGLGFAMRRSRNIARAAGLSNLDKSLASYYTDHQDYPDDGTTVEELTEGEDADLAPYLEGSWDPGPGTTQYYYTNTGYAYIICVSQETLGDGYEYNCMGPGIQSEDDRTNPPGGATCQEHDSGNWTNCN